MIGLRTSAVVHARRSDSTGHRRLVRHRAPPVVVAVCTATIPIGGNQHLPHATPLIEHRSPRLHRLLEPIRELGRPIFGSGSIDIVIFGAPSFWTSTKFDSLFVCALPQKKLLCSCMRSLLWEDGEGAINR